PPGAAHIQIELGAPTPLSSAQQLVVDPIKEKGDAAAEDGKKRASAVKKYLSLLSYATPFDALLYVIGFLAAVALGASQPLFT
ncbi:hypothetical protein HK405_012714, partial [Cladochytrium tenue]